MAKRTSNGNKIRSLPPEMREHLQSVLDVPQAEFEAFLATARAERGAFSKERLASLCASAVTDEAHADALASVLSNEDLDAEKLAGFLGNLRGWSALAGKEGGAFSEGDLEKLATRLESLVPEEDFPSVALYRRAIAASYTGDKPLIASHAFCDARALQNKDGDVEAFVPVVTLSFLCMGPQDAPNPELIFTLTDGTLESTIETLEQARRSLQKLRENLEGRSGYNWISLKEAGNDAEDDR